MTDNLRNATGLARGLRPDARRAQPVEGYANRLGLRRGLQAEHHREELAAAAIRAQRLRGPAELAVAEHELSVQILGEVVEFEGALVEGNCVLAAAGALQASTEREHRAHEFRPQPVAEPH